MTCGAFNQSAANAAEPERPTRAGEAAVRRLLAEFARAWAAHDIDALMGCMAEDVVYDASVGPGPGARYVGSEHVREGILTMLAHDVGAAMDVTDVCIHEDWAVVEWRYVTVGALESARTVRGVDILRFRDGQIILKDAFRKTEG